MDLVRSAGKRSALLTTIWGDDDASSEWKESHDPSSLRATARNSCVFDLFLHVSGIEPVPEYRSNITSTYAAYPLQPNRWRPCMELYLPTNSVASVNHKQPLRIQAMNGFTIAGTKHGGIYYVSDYQTSPTYYGEHIIVYILVLWRSRS